jgi:acyl-CoA synthetase (AMP-forming)/AMP-acid ligase II
MIHRSPYGQLTLPDVSVADLVLDALGDDLDRVTMIDAATDRRLTVGELRDGVRRMASGLLRRGFAKGDVFGIICPNVLEYGIALLAVSRAGGIATTINPLGTADDFAAQLGETQAKLVLTVPALLDRVREGASRAGGTEVVVLGEVPGVTPVSALLEPDPQDVTVPIDPARDLAALPWSSGTSGKPKGVMLTHRNLVAQLHQFGSAQRFEGEHPLIAVLPFFHIYGLVLILYASLWRRLPLVVMQRFELEPFLAALAKYRVEFVPIVPPIVVALAKHPAVDRYDLSSVRFVMSGAAPLGAEVEEACAARLGCKVLQGYGMTELTGASHLYPLEGPPVKRGAVGFLAAGLEARVVDPETGAEQGPGGRGELWLRGPNVTQGYLNQPEATARTVDADGWLRTGDIAFVDPEGHWHIVDRVKELIKYKGHQVAPADLEAILLAHPAIADAAVVPSPCDEAGEVPKAFVVLKAPLSPAEVIEYVAGRVSPYEKVRRVSIVDSIPKSPSGKILRRILVEQERALAGADRAAGPV